MSCSHTVGACCDISIPRVHEEPGNSGRAPKWPRRQPVTMEQQMLPSTSGAGTRLICRHAKVTPNPVFNSTFHQDPR